jgi:putative peptidoglycan lipid II flippase
MRETGIEMNKEEKNILTIDLEDWYHSSEVDTAKDHLLYESQIERNTQRILSVLKKYDVKATFFVLGCIAEKYPELIREIIGAGHEIGSHGYNHQMVNQMSRDEFRADIRRSCAAIETITKKKVISYRAPCWSIDRKNLWALEILEEEGILFDSSLQPFETYLSGDLKLPTIFFNPVINQKRLSLLELPSSVFSLAGLRIPFAGGAYLRFMPQFLILKMMKKQNRTKPAVVYLHPWETDQEQPRIKGGLLDNFIRYTNLKTTLTKFESLLKKFKFIPVCELSHHEEFPAIALTASEDNQPSSSPDVRDFTGKAISGMVILNMLLAMVALVRDIFLASSLGTSAKADALLLAFTIPDLLGNNLIAVAIGVALVPILTDLYLQKGREYLKGFIRMIVLAVGMFSLLLIFFAYLFRADLIGLIGKGMEASVRELTVGLFVFLLPTVAIFPIYTIGSSISNVHSSFRIPSVGPILFNLFFLAGIIYGSIIYPFSNKGVYVIAGSIVLGVIAMAGIVWINILSRRWIAVSPVKGRWFYKEELFRFSKMLIPYVIVLLAYQSVLYAERYLASFLETGTISGLNYAYRISQLPIWVFIAAVGTFSLPQLSKLNKSNQTLALRKDIVKYLKLTLLIILPFTCTFFFLREPIVRLFFQWGAFDTRSISITSGILGGFAVAIIGQGIFAVCIRFFLSMRYIVYPTLAVIFSSILNIAANVVLIKIYGSPGLGIGAAIGGLSHAVLLIYLLNRKTQGYLLAHARSFFRIILASFPVAIAALLFSLAWSYRLVRAHSLIQVIAGGAMICVLITTYLSALLFLRVIKWNKESKNHSKMSFNIL